MVLLIRIIFPIVGTVASAASAAEFWRTDTAACETLVASTRTTLTIIEEWAKSGPLALLPRPENVEVRLGTTGEASVRQSMLSIMISPAETHLTETLAHEYGHLVFSKYMATKSPAWKLWVDEAAIFAREKRDDFEEIIETIRRIKTERRQISRPIQNPLLQESDNVLVELLIDLERMQRELLRPAGLAWAKINSSVSVPYQELFADLVGALASSSFEAYGNLMQAQYQLSIDRHRSKDEDLNPAILRIGRGRAFSTLVLLKGWDDLMSLPELKNHFSHLVLNPARSYIYTRYAPKRMDEATLARFMYALMDALAEEVLELEGFAKYDLLTAEDLNFRLFQRMNGSLHEFEIAPSNLTIDMPR